MEITMDIEDWVKSISNSLPISFGTDEADRYIQYVTSACIENYRHEKYQFSFLAFHLLYMCYIYKEIWQGHNCQVSGLENKIHQKCTQAPYDSPFRLSVVPEKEVIPFLNHFGFHQNKTKQFSASVEWRDCCAHASGLIQYNKAEVETNVKQVLAYIAEIEAKKKNCVTGIFEKYFLAHFKPDDPGSYFPTGFASVESFVQSYLFSVNDLLNILIENKGCLDQSSSDVGPLYRNVFFILLLGWVEEPIDDLIIGDAIEKLKIGIDQQEVTTLSDLMLNELLDVKSILGKEKYAEYLA